MDSPTVDTSELLDAGVGKRLGHVEVRRPNGPSPVLIPLAVVQGARRGPTVWVNAALHGDEYLGPATIVRLLDALDPAAIRGRVILTPTLNPGAVRRMQRADPDEPQDLNRIWSPEPTMAASHGVAEWAAAELIGRSDFVLDLHSGGNRFLQHSFSVFPDIGGPAGSGARGLAKACGLPWIWAHRGPMLEGALITAAVRKGKPAVLLEMGGEGKADSSGIEAMDAAVLSALAHAGVVEGTPSLLDSYRIFQGYTVVRNAREGLWSGIVQPGAAVGKGQPLGRVIDLLGRPLEVVTSPLDSAVAGICTYGFVQVNDYIAELAHDFHDEGRSA